MVSITDILSGATPLIVDVRQTGSSANIAKRICDCAGPGEVLVSETVRLPMVGSSRTEFEDRGDHELKGVPGTWKFFAVRG